MTDRERIEILEAKIAFLMALTRVQGQRLERLENVPPSEEPPPPPPPPDAPSERFDDGTEEKR
jgi:hypothetical protein